MQLGSGGGDGGNAAGGNGGGRISIVVSDAVVNGSILANGGDGVIFGAVTTGGGSGGSIRIEATDLMGSGILQARGGNVPTAGAGAGGGGRVAVYTCEFLLPVANITASGGTGGNPGQPGTVYLTNITKTITATTGSNGSISPSGAVAVACGTDQTFTITPDLGYRIADVLVDAVSVGPVASYTFVAVTQPHTISATFSVANSAPQIATIAPQSVDEGSALALSVTVSDAETPPQQLTFSLEPGAPTGAAIDPGTGQFSWTPTEAQGPGDYSVTVKVRDNGDPILEDTETFAIHVNEVNQPPVLTAIGDKTIEEGAALAFSVAASDADVPANTLSFTLDPGAPEGAAMSSAGEFMWTPTEAQGPQDHAITVRVSDGSAEDFETITVHVTELNTAPVLAAISDQSTLDGVTLTVQATATDADVPANTLTFSIASGAVPGMTLEPASGLFTWTPTAAQAPASYPLTLRVTDDGSPSLHHEQSFVISVMQSNHPPVLAVPSSASGTEGAPLALVASATDPDLPAQTLTFSLMAPSPSDAFIHAETGVVSWTPADNGEFTFRVAVSDGLAGPVTADVAVTIANVDPTPTITTPSSGHVVPVGTTVEFTGTIADPGSADTHAATWTIDATMVTGVVNQSAHTIGASHTFTQAGVYAVSLTVTDDDGGAGSTSLVDGMEAMVVVFDPSAGYVSGGGWLESPAGAYVAAPELAGRANFGFVSRYQSGAFTPSGQTEFKFRVADMKFSSTIYDWLVVAGPKAQYKGSGTINGAGDYGFMLTGSDGDLRDPADQDRLRMKIWDKGTGQMVYDNMLGAPDSTTPSTAIGGGVVIIHKQPKGQGPSAIEPDDPIVERPIVLAVGTPMPNPSGGATSIRLALPDAAQVTAEVYDLAGRNIATLWTGPLDAREHSLMWNGRGREGKRVRGGVYFLRIHVQLSSGGASRVVRRMVRLD